MDALTHAVEAYIGRSTTKGTRADAVKAVQLIFENIEASSNHTSKEAEKNMLLASHLAGRAFTRSYVGYIHAVSHSLSGKYNMPHGLTNAVLLPIVLEMYGSCVYKKLSKLAVAVNLGTGTEDKKILSEKFIRAIYDLNNRLNIPNHIDGIKEEDLDELSRYADKEANPLYPVPTLWNAEALKAIYRKVGSNQMNSDDILKKQKDFFATGVTLPVAYRKQALKRLYAAIDKYEEKLYEALRKDLDKSKTESYMCEIGLTKSEITYMLKHMGKFAKEKRVRTPMAQYISRSFVKPSPYGNVLIVSPWNYPFLLTIEPLVDALAAGNTAVLKPSAYSPNTSQVIRDMIAECFRPEYVTVVTGGREENAHLFSMDFNYIFFTGSQHVGKEVLLKAAEKLIPVTLELGGKSPCIVDETANIALAAKRIIFGKFVNCGQTCVAPDYIYCHESIKDALITEFKKQITAQYGKYPLKNENYGKIINKKHFERLNGLIDNSKVVAGGESDKEQLKIAPTVMDNVTFDDAVMGEEIFGPILPVLTYSSIEKAIDVVRSRQNPLALYIFSSNRKNISMWKNNVLYGGGCVNDTLIHLATSAMGFGGVGASGMGAYHGKRGFDTFTHYKSIVDKKNIIDLPMRYQPYSSFNDKLIKMFLR